MAMATWRVLALSALAGAVALPASAQVVIGGSDRPSVEINWAVLDSLGRQPTLADMLKAEVPATPAAQSRLPGTQAPVAYRPFKGDKGGAAPAPQKTAKALPAAMPASEPVYKPYQPVKAEPKPVPVAAAPAPEPAKPAAKVEIAKAEIAKVEAPAPAAPSPAPVTAAPAPAPKPVAAKPEPAKVQPAKPEPAKPAGPQVALPEIAKPAPAPAPAPQPAPPAATAVVQPMGLTPPPLAKAPAAPAAPVAKVEPPPAPAPAPAAISVPVPPPAQIASLPPAAAPVVVPAPAPAVPRLSGDTLSIIFSADESKVPASSQASLDALAKRLEKDAGLGLQLMAFAAGNEADASKARRLSLSRALEVRKALMEKGVRSTRIEVRALGNRLEGQGPADRVDAVMVAR
ncbi:OmpA family protein [Magnetospirillum sp. UT-4]|uniref:OmpA family protein n=1 Tax=Magnetospirillum sp. UT-4 TaxID=2681467 RepID=UPI00137E4666|nr:OmpA family protein [Magnetospirillum sp. UT-4]CAA7620343.1 Lysophospholipase [Magnetospirillum sp. UT-4]